MGGVEPAVFIEPVCTPRKRVHQPFHRQRLADHAGGKGQNLCRCAVEMTRERLTARTGISDARVTRAGVCIASIDDKRAGQRLRQVIARYRHWCRAEAVAREHGCRLAPGGSFKHNQIGAPRITQAGGACANANARYGMQH